MMKWFIAIVVLAVIVWWVYKRYFRLSRFQDYRNRAMRFEMKTTANWERKQEYIQRAIELRKQAANLDVRNPMEQADNYLQLARLYKDLFDAEKCMYYFDLSWGIAKDRKFPYSKGILDFVNVYVQSGRRNRALEILNDCIANPHLSKKASELIPYKEALEQGRWLGFGGPMSSPKP